MFQNSKLLGLKNFWIPEHVEVLEEYDPQRTYELYVALLHTSSYESSTRFVICVLHRVLYGKLVNMLS